MVDAEIGLETNVGLIPHGSSHWMERRSLIKMMGAATTAASTGLLAGKASAAEKVAIALIPGLTADGFYVTMRKGADTAVAAWQNQSSSLPAIRRFPAVVAGVGGRLGNVS